MRGAIRLFLSLGGVFLLIQCTQERMIVEPIRDQNEMPTDPNQMPADQNDRPLAPAALVAFGGDRGSAPGEIAMTMILPPDVDLYDVFQIRRLAGDIPPNEDCSSDGEVIRNITNLNETSFIDDTGVPGDYFSYRACIYGPTGNLTSSNIASSVRARPNPCRFFDPLKQNTNDILYRFSRDVDGSDAPVWSGPPQGGLTVNIADYTTSGTYEGNDYVFAFTAYWLGNNIHIWSCFPYDSYFKHIFDTRIINADEEGCTIKIDLKTDCRDESSQNRRCPSTADCRSRY